MVKYFEVAGHAFGLSLPDGSPLCKMLKQYSPFEIPECADEIFHVELVESLPECQEKIEYDFTSAETEKPHFMVSSIGQGWLVRFAPDQLSPFCCTLMTDASFTSGRFKVEHRRSSALFGLNNSIMLMYACRTSGMNTLEMHSSVVVKDGRAYMFLGKSGAGKSTHSRQWLGHIPGSFLLNDDNPVVRLDSDGVAWAYGTPWSGKTPCYVNDKAPIAAFVKIKKDPRNSITRLSRARTFSILMSSCSNFRVDNVVTSNIMNSISSLSVGVPAFLLHCRADHEAADVCYSAVK